MDAALASGPPPNRNRPLTILPSIVEPQEDDVLAKGKVWNSNSSITLTVLSFS